MAAGGSDVEGLVDLLSGHVGRYVFVSSIMAYDQTMVGHFPWTENMPTNPDGVGAYGGFKAAAEASMPRSPPCPGSPSPSFARRRSTGPTTTSSTWRLRCSCDCCRTAPFWCPTVAWSAARTGTSMISARRCSSCRVTRRPLAKCLNVSTDSVDANTYIDTLATVRRKVGQGSGECPTRCCRRSPHPCSGICSSRGTTRSSAPPSSSR